MCQTANNAFQQMYLHVLLFSRQKTDDNRHRRERERRRSRSRDRRGSDRTREKRHREEEKSHKKHRSHKDSEDRWVLVVVTEKEMCCLKIASVIPVPHSLGK